MHVSQRLLRGLSMGRAREVGIRLVWRGSIVRGYWVARARMSVKGQRPAIMGDYKVSFLVLVGGVDRGGGSICRVSLWCLSQCFFKMEPIGFSGV